MNKNLLANPGLWQYQPQGVADSSATFAGTEQTTAAYVMQNLDVNALHINVGLRVENTNIGYVGYAATQGPSDTATPYIAGRVHGTSAYTDLFPSLQLKYALDENTNLRLAVTRGIARPDYVQLAPDIIADGAQGGGIQTPITEGNPNLKPEHAWNYDLLGEHYLSSVGVISAGAFYKSINDFIFYRIAAYNGPLSDGEANTYVEQPQNGPSATLWGVEFDYMQHFAFLAWCAAWPRVRRQLHARRVTRDRPAGHDLCAQCRLHDPVNGDSINQFAHTPYRHAAIPRQFPNMFNLSLLYDYSLDLGADYGAVSRVEHLPVRHERHERSDERRRVQLSALPDRRLVRMDDLRSQCSDAPSGQHRITRSSAFSRARRCTRGTTSVSITARPS